MNSTLVTGERQISTSGATGLQGYVGIVAMAVSIGGFLFLALLASEQAYTLFDLKVAHWVQGVDVPGVTSRQVV